MKSKYFVLFALFVALFASCNKPNNDNGSVAISWDYNTFRELTQIKIANADYVEDNLYYPRAKQLSDGAILLSFSNHHYGWNIYTSRSEDGGLSWQDAMLLRHCYAEQSSIGNDEKVFVNPDFIELSDGRILLAYQWRYKNGYGDIPNTNNNCGIEIIFSSDKGRTWGEPREVYRGRCWEPALLQLPSGEIQMYITSSQDVVGGTSYPRTIVIRSFDDGRTWQGKECCGINDNEAISRTIDDRFAYDGMPSGVWLDDNRGIVVPLEVWHGKYVVDQTPIVIKTTAEENWHFDQQKMLNEGGPDYPMKKQINKDMHGYGPYCTKLSSGEVVVLCNGTYKGVEGIWTLVGDTSADNFSRATSPFAGYWGSIDAIRDNKVIATATVKYKQNGVERGKIRLMTGRLNYSKKIKKGEPTMTSVESFNRSSNDYWFLGKQTSSSVFADFGYTNRDFIVAAYLFDDKLSAFTPENSDAAVLLVSRKGNNYKIVVNANADYLLYREETLSWNLIDKGVTPNVEVVGTINDDSDTDTGFAAKLSVPWRLIGGKPSRGEEIKIHMRRHYKSLSKEKPIYLLEDLEGENSDYPGEWLSVKLQ